MDVCGSGALIARSEITLMQSPDNPTHWRALCSNLKASNDDDIYIDVKVRLTTLAPIVNQTLRYALADAGFYIPSPGPSNEWLEWQTRRRHCDEQRNNDNSRFVVTDESTSSTTQPPLHLRCFYCATEISFAELSSFHSPLQVHVERARDCNFAVSAMFIRICTSDYRWEEEEYSSPPSSPCESQPNDDDPSTDNLCV